MWWRGLLILCEMREYRRVLGSMYFLDFGLLQGNSGGAEKCKLRHYTTTYFTVLSSTIYRQR